MVNVYRKFLGYVLVGKGQILLLFIILAAGAAVRFAHSGSEDIDLGQLAFASSISTDQGTVLFSDVDQGLFVILDGGNLQWRSGNDSFFIAEGVINLHAQDDRFWIKSRTNISELIINTGAVIPLISADSPGSRGIPFAEARLVGTGQRHFYLDTGSGIHGIAQWGLVEGPYHFHGRRNPTTVEPDWQHGVAFVQDNSWSVYVNFIEQDSVHFDSTQGELKEVALSPDRLNLVYALQQGAVTQVWYAGITGADAELLYQWEMQFSSLKALWSPDLRLTAVSILGYEGEAGFTDNFHSSTFLFQPGQDTVVLNQSYGPEIRALVPTAWDSRQYLIWFNWLHEEIPIPVSYSLISQ